MKVPLPENEAARLRTLRLYHILDTASEKILDDLTRLAASICETPISLISLVDENRQWFKSRVGLSVTETSRDVAFCAHAILRDEILVVPDALADVRFAENPLVRSDPSIRFYAGAPLTVANGLTLGTLCVLDYKPRELSGDQREALATLREAVVAHLELRRAMKDFHAVEQLLPLCAWCRNVRTADGTWLPLLEYILQSTGVTHGLCPVCAEGVRRQIRDSE